MTFHIRAAVAAIALAVSGSAATSATFDLTSGLTGRDYNTATNGGVSVSADGINLTVGGARCEAGNCAGTVAATDIQRWENGIGLKASGTYEFFNGWRYSDSHQVDGNNYLPGKRFDEMVTLAFDRVVSLTSLAFSYVEAKNDEFAVWGRNDNVWSLLSGPTFIDETTTPGVHRPGEKAVGGLFGDAFAIATTDENDAWKLRAVTAMPVVAQPPAPVPLPAGGALLIGGLAALGMVRSRRKA